jgi:hypothetical protein
LFSEKRFNHRDCNGYKTVANDFFKKRDLTRDYNGYKTVANDFLVLI